MSGRIPQEFIDDLIARVDIVEVIDERVPLKRGGRNLSACCPFHTEKTPSFTVSPEKQFYHCFGCGAHGTAIGFLMDYARLDFREAVEELARRAGVGMPVMQAADSGQQRRRTQVFDVMEEAANIYGRDLAEKEAGAVARAYLSKRGLDATTAQRFELGYARAGWDNLARRANGDPQKLAGLSEAGLITQREQRGFYDRFRNRVMFPIRDRRGRVVGFGGRVMGDDTPKYLNSPETVAFQKGRELYGLYQVRRARQRPRQILVVEGYMDVVALAQHGIENAVATLGTAATKDHLEALFREVPEIIFCFDGDDAGRSAAWRAAETAIPLMREGRQAGFVFLAQGDDPDSAVRDQGRERFLAFLKKGMDLPTFLFSTLERDKDLNSLGGRAALVDAVKPLLAKFPPGGTRDVISATLREKTGAGGPTVPPGMPEGPPVRPVSRPKEGGVMPLVRRLVRILVHQPELARHVDEPRELNVADSPGLKILSELLEILRERPDLTTPGIVEHFREHPLGGSVAKLVLDSPPMLGEGLRDELIDGLRQLKIQQNRRRLEHLQLKMQKDELTEAEKQTLKQLLTGTSQ